MLPSRPSPRNGGGFPAQPRSRSVGRSRQDESSSSRTYDRERATSRSNGGGGGGASSSSSRSLRSQRSMGNVSSSRDRSEPPPMPSSRYNRRDHSSRDYEPSSATISRKESDASSASTVYSTASSLMDRIMGGYASSRTSLEEEAEPPKRGRGQESRFAKQEGRSSYEEEDDTGTVAPGAGSSLWGRLASAAGTLGVDVSKAWAANVTYYAGEETPPGEESRLTKAMKAYHIEKARDPSDLPEWLFEEHERRPVGRSRFATRPNDRQDDDYEDAPMSSPAPKSRGLRDIYDSAAASSPNPRSTARSDRSAPNRFVDEPTAPSKATNRLKALRDARRPNNRFDDDPPINRNENEGSRRVNEYGGGARRDGRRGGGEVPERRAPPRTGLPSGPGGRTRRL